MSTPGRPKGEFRSAQHEGTPVSLPATVFCRAAAAVLLLAAAEARAGVDLSIGLNLPLGHHGHHGAVYGTLPHGAVSVQIGGGRHGHHGRHGGHHYRPWGPHWVWMAPPVVLGAPLRVETLRPDPPWPAAPSRPDPVIDPRQGQSAAQTEADRQACNRGATTQAAALADAEVFHRAVQACMDGRGYSMK